MHTILFDLDGTLVDTIQLIVESARHAFASHPGPRATDAEWTASIGIPLVECFRPYSRDEEELQALIREYRVYQLAHHDRLTRVYRDVPETLETLRALGHPMGIVTSKANEIARRTLRHVGIERYMDVVVGADSVTKHKPDPAPVRHALAELGAHPEDAIFVGDSPHDMQSGRAALVRTVAALWGPFSRDELSVTHPDHYLDHIGQLPGLVARL